jgi:membrane-associated protease RseP (regulator of RpoE activity)
MSETNPSIPSPELPWPVEAVYVRRPARRYWLPLLLLVTTFATTLTVGARLQYNFSQNLPMLSENDDALPMFPVTWISHHPSRLLLGLPFSLALMGILLAHEMGHYLYCRRYGVEATLPFFIPAPTLIGTMGAFIRIRSRIRSRDALFDIGIAGPIAGFVVALPLMIVGLLLSRATPAPLNQDIELGFPLIFQLGRYFGGACTGHWLPGFGQVLLHPIAIAAWVGMFATSLNLLPGGQLDGGHIVFALNPAAHRWVSRLAVAALVPLGIFFWVGWFVWAVLLWVSGLRHPAVPPWPGLSRRRRATSLLALALLLLTLVPAPFEHASGRDAADDVKALIHLRLHR